MTFEQLPQAVEKMFDKLNKIEALLEKKSTESIAETDELLTVNDAAKFLSLSVPTIYTKISKGELPVMKRSKRCYFSKSDLVNYLKQGRRQTNSEINTAAQAYIDGNVK